jgi:hypothetical protein
MFIKNEQPYFIELILLDELGSQNSSWYQSLSHYKWDLHYLSCDKDQEKYWLKRERRVLRNNLILSIDKILDIFIKNEQFTFIEQDFFIC